MINSGGLQPVLNRQCITAIMDTDRVTTWKVRKHAYSQGIVGDEVEYRSLVSAVLVHSCFKEWDCENCFLCGHLFYFKAHEL